MKIKLNATFAVTFSVNFSQKRVYGEHYTHIKINKTFRVQHFQRESKKVLGLGLCS